MLATRTKTGVAGLAVGDDNDDDVDKVDATSDLATAGFLMCSIELFVSSAFDLFGFGSCHSSRVINMGSAPCLRAQMRDQV